MADGVLRFSDEGVSSLGNQRQVGIGESNGWPDDALRERVVNCAAYRFVCEDVCPLAALLGDDADVRLAHAPGLDVPVVGRDMDLKTVVDQEFQQLP